MAKAVDSDSEEVFNLLECSICLDLCEIPVSMCKNGHNVCQSHIRELMDQSCPVCRSPYSQGLTRNRLAETMILKLKKEKAEEEEMKEMLLIATKSQNVYLGSNIKTNNMNCSSQQSAINDTWDAQINSQNRNRNAPVGTNAVSRPVATTSVGRIRCPIRYDGCLNREIEQGSYINHLKDVHSVTTVSNSFAFKNYYIRGDKLVKDGSSKFLILENFGKSFLVTACQQGGFINVWVALHGHPDECRNYSALVKLVGTENLDPIMFSGTIQATTANRNPLFNTFENMNCRSIAERDVRQRIMTNQRTKVKYWRISVSVNQINSLPVSTFQLRPDHSVQAVNSTSSAGSLLSRTELTRPTSNQNTSTTSTHLNRPMSDFARDFYTYSPRTVDIGFSDMSSDDDNDIDSAILTTPEISSSPPLINLNDTSPSPCPTCPSSSHNEDRIIIHHPPIRPRSILRSPPPRPPLPAHNLLLEPIESSANPSASLGGVTRTEEGIQSLLSPMESRLIEEERRLTQARLFLERRRSASTDRSDKSCSIQ